MMQRPSGYMMSYLPEFATEDGRNAFVKNHPIGGVEVRVEGRLQMVLRSTVGRLRR